MGNINEKSTISKLRDQTNWHQWYTAIKLALIGDGYFDIIEDKRSKPQPPEQLKQLEDEPPDQFKERQRDYRLDIREYKQDIKA